LKAVTYDFWNTLMWEEPGTMRGIRRRQVELALEEAELEVDADAIEQGLLAISGKQRDAWMNGEMFHPEDGARHFVGSLGDRLSVEHHDRVTEALLLGSVRPELNAADEVHSTLRTLKENGFKLAIVCDVGLAPSTVLRDSLEGAGLLEYFDGWAFSDEVGHYKPSPEIFRHALDSIGATPEEAWHVGDLRRTDVAGSRSFGMTPVRYRGVADDVEDHPEATHVITSHLEILELLELAS
jgi:putative hydrolase of the HAD superfamily